MICTAAAVAIFCNQFADLPWIIVNDTFHSV